MDTLNHPVRIISHYDSLSLDISQGVPFLISHTWVMFFYSAPDNPGIYLAVLFYQLGKKIDCPWVKIWHFFTLVGVHFCDLY